MPSATKFEPACISPTRQRRASAPEIRNLWNDRSNMPNISSRTTLDDLAEVYFDSMHDPGIYYDRTLSYTFEIF